MKRNPIRVNKNIGRGNIGHFLYAEYSAALPKRATFVAKQLSTINSIFKKLFADDNFRTLLRAESETGVPVYLKPILERGENHAKEDRGARRR
jgi:hypothetical protein